MNFAEMTHDELSAMLTASQDIAALAPVVKEIKAELKARKVAEIKAEQTAALRALADASAQMLSDVSNSKVAEISDRDGQAYKAQARSLRAVIESAYGVTSLRAQHAVTVLTAGNGATDVKTVADAVEYAKAHSKSTVYQS